MADWASSDAGSDRSCGSAPQCSQHEAVQRPTATASGLTCHRCVDTVTEQLIELEAIQSISVDLVTGGVSNVTVTASSEVSDADLQSL